MAGVPFVHGKNESQKTILVMVLYPVNCNADGDAGKKSMVKIHPMCSIMGILGIVLW